MNFRYYLRGLGIGVLVTAVILGLTDKNETMTDAEIRIRAARLGMVEERVLSDLDEEGTMEPSSEENMQESQETQQIQETEETQDATADEENENSATEDVSEEDESVETPNAYVVIKIESGNTSNTVCQKLYDAGLINSKANYNRYLMENGYDRKLSTGEHRIPIDASEEEIAKILCRMD